MTYDIFISYKRKSLATANNLYYRLTTRGYSTFFDLEEMRKDNFDVQLLNYIENAKDIFVVLEEGSLDACKKADWEKDWFCKEIAHALKKKKNIIPILIGGYKMPNQSFFPDELKELSLKNSPEFSFSYFEEYLNKLIDKGYITSEAHANNVATSIFKFYSNENCQVFKEGKLVCCLEGFSDEPYYLPVPRKGDYRFKCVNSITDESILRKEHIDAEEERDIDILWEEHKPFIPSQEWPESALISGDNYLVDFGYGKFNMIRVEGGEMTIGATIEQENYAETNEYPSHSVNIPTFYIGQFPITQNVWEIVMGYNKSHFKDLEKHLLSDLEEQSLLTKAGTIYGMWSTFGTLHQSRSVAAIAKVKGREWIKNKIKKYMSSESCEVGHYPVENITHDQAIEFVRRLSKMTNIRFNLPTEEEWEYAARGGKKSKHYRFAGSDNIDDVAWYRDNSDSRTHPVGEKLPNELGIYDMCGNVWEWTATPAHTYGNEVVAGGNVFIRRGGSWWHEAQNCRVSKRYASDHLKKTSGLGLRVVIRENVL